MHLEFSSTTLTCKAFNPDGTLWREFPMSDHAIAPGFGHHGRCPRGSYPLGRPVRIHEVSMGDFFTPVESVPGREGIGIHGGGTGLPSPFTPHQHLLPTLGCLRVENESNDFLGFELTERFDAGEKSEITISGP
jgi:hypothetical protein